MAVRRRLVRYYVATFVGAILAFTLAYDFGMSFFEGRPRTLLHSFEVVMQTFTTTGYGQDAGWGPEMTLVVVGMQLTSLVLIFAAFPIVIVPLVEEALASSPPTAVGDVEDHVIVCRHSPRTATLREELATRGVPAVVIESDRETATDLFDRDRRVVHADPDSVETLREAGADGARTVVLALDDDTTTLVATFVIRELNPRVEVIARADETESVRKLYRAGADYVLSLSSVTGRLLASRIVGEDVFSFGQQLKIVRVPAPEPATLEELSIRERTGCTAVAVQRRDGRVDTDLAGWTELGEHDYLVLAGTDEDVARYEGTFRG